METTENNANPQEMNEARNPKKSLKERCKETGAIPFENFKKEWMRQLNNSLRENGIH